MLKREDHIFTNLNGYDSFNLKEAFKAHIKLQSRNTTGSILLKP